MMALLATMCCTLRSFSLEHPSGKNSDICIWMSDSKAEMAKKK